MRLSGYAQRVADLESSLTDLDTRLLATGSRRKAYFLDERAALKQARSAVTHALVRAYAAPLVRESMEREPSSWAYR